MRPIAGPASRGSWYGGRRLVSLDGSVLDLADEPGNLQAFGRPGASRGASAYPQLRFVSLVENGTHVLFGSRMGACAESEIALARQLLPALKKDMLCLADRNFFSDSLWKQARGTGAHLLWRVKKNLRLPVERPLADGSYLSRIYSCERDRRRQTNGIKVRVIEYRLEGVENAEPLYRLLTTLLDPAAAPAPELAALYPQRWEIETAFDELKTHLRGSKIVLRSKTPELVRQGILGAAASAFCDSRSDAGSRPQRPAGPGPAFLRARGAAGPPQTGDRGGPSPLGLEKRFTSRCSTNCSRSGWSPLAATAARAASSAR